MALWNKLQTELDRFGRVAQSAFDEGKARLEIMRVRQLADKAAQALGYAVHNARKSGGELDADSYARLSSTLAAHEAEVERLEAQLEAAKASRTEAEPASSTGAAGTPGDVPPAGASPDAPSPQSGIDPAMGDMGGRPSSGSAGESSSPSTSGSHGTVYPPYSGPSGTSGPY